MGRLRRPGDHRPLGQDGRAVDAQAARHPVHRAERTGADARARRARPRARARGRSGAARGRVRPARGRRRVDRRQRRRALPRAHLLERAADRAVVGLPRPVRPRGVEQRLRARARTGRRVGPLGRGPRASRHVLRPRDGRLASPRLRQRLRVDLGTRAGEVAGGGAGRAPERHVLWLDGAHDPGRRAERGRGRRPLQPRRECDALLGAPARRARECRTARLPEPCRGDRAGRCRPDHRGASGQALRRALRADRGARYGRQQGVEPRAVDRVEAIAGRRFDLLVVGGGIVGAGIAEAATAHGLTVALVERCDFAGATSSASSKLIHGGLRYLQMGDVRLVREAHQERRALMNVVAPHLVHRLPFVFPLYEHGPHRPLVVRTGVLLYSALARARLNGRVSESRAVRLVPQLRTDDLHSSALYADAWTNDGRLTLANIRAAADRGAAVLNYAEVVAIDRGGAEVAVDGETVRVQAASVVNATGPWLDRVRRLEDEQATDSIRLSKGVHVIADGGDGWGAAVTIPHDKVRVSFAIPWEGKLLLGTTDTLHDGEPEDAQATDDDVRTILAEASVAVREIGTVRATFCGLRVLPGGPGETANARRETVYTRGRLGMLSVAGGKLTTYRRIALDALDQLGVRNVDRRPRQLPGAEGLSHVRWPLELEPATRTHLLHLYGSLAREVVAPAVEDPSLLEPLVAGRPDLRAQALYAREREWARTDEDVLRRRTTAWLAGLDSKHGSEVHTADPAAGS